MADEDKNGFAISPRPNAIELERTIASLRSAMSEEKAREAEAVLRRMFERAMSWHGSGANGTKGG